MKIKTDFIEIVTAIEQIELRCGKNIFKDIDDLEIIQSDRTVATFENGKASIQARSLSEAYCALGRLLSEMKRDTHICVEVYKRMEKLGVMLDCARNAVPHCFSNKSYH